MKLTIQHVKQFFIVTAIMTGALLLLNFGGSTAMAQLINDGDVPDNLAGTTGTAGGSARGLIKNIINFFLGFLGLLAVVMVIYGGFLYVSSAGNEENVNKAKKILLYAVVGIIVIIAAFALVNTLLKVGTGSDA